MCVPVLPLVGENFISHCGYSVNSNLGLERNGLALLMMNILKKVFLLQKILNY
jgi:hypothetical protein